MVTTSPSVTPVVETPHVDPVAHAHPDTEPESDPEPKPDPEPHADLDADPDAELHAQPDPIAVVPPDGDPVGSRHRGAHSGGLRRYVMSELADTARVRVARFIVLVLAAACLVGVAPRHRRRRVTRRRPRRWVGYADPRRRRRGRRLDRGLSRGRHQAVPDHADQEPQPSGL